VILRLPPLRPLLSSPPIFSPRPVANCTLRPSTSGEEIGSRRTDAERTGLPTRAARPRLPQ
jgi:hypothetical protein